MHEYDIAFKLVLQSVDLVMRELAGARIARWLSVELPEVRNTRVDLLGETETGELVHIELQSTNDPKMPLRMAEYCLRVYRLFGRFPHQVVVYVGEPPLATASELNGPALTYSYRLLDIRELNGERLLESEQVGDNIVAILARVKDPKAAIHRVVQRIAKLDAGDRESALRSLLILAGLRKLSQVVVEETRNVPILNDILDHEVLGREYKKGVEQGEVIILRRQIQTRFGNVPAWVEQRLTNLSTAELEQLGIRILDAATLEDLFRE